MAEVWKNKYVAIFDSIFGDCDKLLTFPQGILTLGDLAAYLSNLDLENINFWVKMECKIILYVSLKMDIVSLFFPVKKYPETRKVKYLLY